MQKQRGFVQLEIRRTIYGLPQVGILANKQLREKILPAGYYEVAHTPGLWRHVTRPIQCTLVVDDFGIKYEGKKHLDHLIAAIRSAGYCERFVWDPLSKEEQQVNMVTAGFVFFV